MLKDLKWENAKLKPKRARVSQTNRKILLRAADILDEAGWCRNSRKNSEGNYCAVGAIGQAAFEIEHGEYPFALTTKEVQVSQILLAHLTRTGKIKGSSVICIPDWNDEVGRTKEQVTSAMRAAAMGLD